MSRGLPVSAAMTTHFATLTPATRLEDAAQALLRTRQTDFAVIDAAGKPVGILGRGDLVRARKRLGPEARVIDAVTTGLQITGLPIIGQRRPLEEAFRLLQERSAPAVAAVDDSGRLVGLVTSETAAQMLTLQKGLPKDVRLGPWTRATGA
jgi:stage IV sporulation protein FB